MKYLLILLTGLLTISCGSSVPDENIAIVKQYVDAVENLDYSTMESLLAENYEGYGPSAGDTIRRASAVESWKNNIENLYEKIEYTRSQFADVVIPDGPNKGHWVANWAELNIEYKNGQGKVTIWANSNYKIENGKIVQSLTFYNEADALRQLGYVFINLNDL